MTTKRYGTMADLLGKTIREIDGMEKGSEFYILTFEDGSTLTHEHRQDCCESVDVEDVAGDVADLIGSPLLICEAVENDPPTDYEERDSSETWTFYKFATVKGYVTIRWFGSSNGYYSETPHETIELAP